MAGSIVANEKESAGKERARTVKVRDKRNKNEADKERRRKNGKFNGIELKMGPHK